MNCIVAVLTLSVTATAFINGNYFHVLTFLILSVISIFYQKTVYYITHQNTFSTHFHNADKYYLRNPQYLLHFIKYVRLSITYRTGAKHTL